VRSPFIFNRSIRSPALGSIAASEPTQPFALAPRSGERVRARGRAELLTPSRTEGKPLILAFAFFALLVGGCSMSKWTVKPHQRELLADRIMQLDADAQERSAEEHVLANREGAIGGTGTSGGGCGCN
jgi:hypothetical protein